MVAYNVARVTQPKSTFQVDVYDYGIPRVTEVDAEGGVEAVTRAGDSLSPAAVSHGVTITNPRKSSVPRGH